MIYNFNLLQDFVHGLYLRAQYYIVALVILLVQYCNVHDENVVVQSKMILFFNNIPSIIYIYNIYNKYIYVVRDSWID